MLSRAITLNCRLQLLGRHIDFYLKCPLEQEPGAVAGNVKTINVLCTWRWEGAALGLVTASVGSSASSPEG